MPKRKTASDTGQRERFVKAAREVGCSEDEAAFDCVIKKIAKPKVKPARHAKGAKQKK
jgi:hypothetical protein